MIYAGFDEAGRSHDVGVRVRAVRLGWKKKGWLCLLAAAARYLGRRGVKGQMDVCPPRRSEVVDGYPPSHDRPRIPLGPPEG